MQRVRVLIVEDDPSQAEALASVVAARDREVLVAADGEKGLSLARSGVELIVADYMLPGMNGVELVRRLREEKIGAPVLIVSGEATVAVAVGAFTGADRHASGLLAEADGGTLLIDEIGDMPLSLQSKLLRFLQTKEFRRVGASRPTRVNVRVVVATNRELEAEVARGSFRQDLFYRINVFPIRLPPLRERREDVPLIADHFLRAISRGIDRSLEGFTPEALAALAAQEWPGNARQLENVIRRLAVMAAGPRIGVAECEAVLGRVAAENGKRRDVRPFHEARAEAVAKFEQTYLDGLLR